MEGKLTLNLAPDWDSVKASWDACRSFFLGRGMSQDVAYSLCMASQELLENAVKYGAFERPDQRIALEIEAGPREITLEVRSPAADSARLKKLDETIQWIRGFQNPFEAYVEKLKQVAAQPYTEGESGLGLTRVAYEGQCILDFYVDDTNTLAISAVYRPVGGEQAHAN